MIEKKSMKKFLIFSILGLFIISMMGGVLAETLTDRIIIIIQTAIEPATNVVGASGENNFITQALFGVLLAMIVYTVLQPFLENKYITWVATGAVTILAIIAFPEGIIEAIRTQYGIMGATILSIIPFAVIFMFTVRLDSALLAKIVWIVYTMYYFVISIGSVFAADLDKPFTILPHIGAILAGAAMVFFLGWIRKWFEDQGFREDYDVAKRELDARMALKKLQQAEATETLHQE
jgi:hypothetical protein